MMSGNDPAAPIDIEAKRGLPGLRSQREWHLVSWGGGGCVDPVVLQPLDTRLESTSLCTLVRGMSVSTCVCVAQRGPRSRSAGDQMLIIRI